MMKPHDQEFRIKLATALCPIEQTGQDAVETLKLVLN